MKNINERYEIIKIISTQSNQVEYLVKDQLYGGMLKRMKVFDSELSNVEFVKKFERGFIELKNHEHEGIFNLHEFSALTFMEGTKISRRQFFYTYEYFDEADRIDYLDLDKSEVTNVIVQLLKIIKFLHFRGVVYKYLSFDHIYLYKKDNEVTLKLADLAHISIIDHNYTATNDYNSDFIAPEVNWGEKLSFKADIFSLGMVFYYLYFQLDYRLKGIQKITPVNTLNKFILRATSQVHEERFERVEDFIDQLSKLIWIKVDKNDKKYYDRIYKNTRIVGREKIIKNIFALIEDKHKKISNTQAIMLSGEEGSGKSRIIREAYHFCRFSKYGFVHLTPNQSKDEYYCIKSIVRHILNQDDLSPLILSKYGAELNALVPDLSNTYKNSLEKVDLNEDYLRIINRAYNFVLDYYSTNFVIVLVDDADALSKYDRLFFEQLLLSNSNIGYLLIFAGTSIQVLTDKNIEDLENISFSYLTTEEIGRLIKSLIGINYIPYKLLTMLNAETQGKVSLIRQLLQECYESGVIRFDEEKWDWVYSEDQRDYKIEKYSNIKHNYPIGMSQLTLEEISYLKILCVLISSFNMATMFEMLEISEEDGYSFLYKIEPKKLITKRISDVEYVFSFTSNFVKLKFKDMLTDEEKNTYKRRAAQIILNQYLKQKIYNEDLIYYLNASHQYKEVYKYALEFAEYYKKEKLFSQSIEMIKKANTACLNLGMEDESNKLTLDLIIDLINCGFVEEGSSLLEEFLQNTDDIKLEIQARNLSAQLLYSQMKVDESEYISRKVMEESKAIKSWGSYFQGYLQVLECYMFRHEYKELNSMLKEAIKESKKRNNSEYYYAFKLLKAFVDESMSSDEVFSELDKCESYFKLEGMHHRLLKTYDVKGVLYHSLKGDIIGAKEYFKKGDDLAIQCGFFIHKARHHKHLGDVYEHEGKYRLAAENYDMSTQATIKYNLPSVHSIVINSSCSVKIKLAEYSKAYTQMSKLEHEISTSMIRKITKIDYSILVIEYMIAIKNIIKAKETRYSLDLSQSTDKFRKFKVKVLDLRLQYESNILNEEYRLTDAFYNNILSVSNEVSNARQGKIFREFLLDIIMDYIIVDDLIGVSRLRQIDDTIKDIYSTKMVRIKRDIINACLSDYTISRFIDILPNIGDESPELKWKSYCILGNLYISEGDYYNALKNLLTAFDVVSDLSKQVPADHRSSFVLNDPFKIILRTNLNKTVRLLSGESDLVSSLNDALILNVKDFFDISNVNRLFSGNSYHIVSSGQDQSNLFQEESGEGALIASFSKDDVENLKIILMAMAKITIAERAFLYLMSEEDELSQIISINDEDKPRDIMSFIYNVGNDAAGVYVSKVIADSNTRLLSSNEKGLIYFPIFEGKNNKPVLNGKRKYDFFTSKKRIIAYVLLETDNLINRFNKESFNHVKAYSSLISIFVDNYNLKINSTLDKLTGVYLRKHFENQFTSILAASRRNGELLSVVMLDIDKFKVVNDTYGHRKGDHILTALGSVLNSSIRTTDLAGRYGGEEFIILLPSTDSTSAYQVAEKIRKNVEDAKLLGLDSHLTISLGIATYPEDGSTEAELIERADRALYYSKENGRNQTTSWDPIILKTGQRYDRLTGIITGQIATDTRNVQAMIKIINSIDANDSIEVVREEIFTTILDIVQGASIELYTYNDSLEINESVMIERGNSGLKIVENIDWRNIKRFGLSNISDFFIDWGERINPDQTDIIDWKSIIVQSFDTDIARGLMLIKVPISENEFDFSNFNFVYSLRKILERVLFKKNID